MAQSAALIDEAREECIAQSKGLGKETEADKVLQGVNDTFGLTTFLCIATPLTFITQGKVRRQPQTPDADGHA